MFFFLNSQFPELIFKIQDFNLISEAPVSSKFNSQLPKTPILTMQKWVLLFQFLMNRKCDPLMVFIFLVNLKSLKITWANIW